MKHFVVATAGHVDHGKSSLVKALTGTDPDRLPEEKARKITIDLGFAELNLPGPDGEEIHAAIVDVPGHEDFVRNMIAGVGSIDLALLVVAADDGWMPQTEEHLQILEYLGVEHAVIALTKIDLGDAHKAEDEIREQLRATAFASAPIVRTSLQPGNLTALSTQVYEVGVAELKNTLGVELSQIEPQRDIGKPRLCVDRAFTLRGIGSVVTGTLTGGAFRVGDEVAVQPRKIFARIRSIQNHGRTVDVALPGMRTAINLADVEANRDVLRGDVLTISGLDTTTRLDVRIRRSPRLRHAVAMKSGATAYVHHGSARVRARIFLREDRHLAVGETAIAQLRLENPLLVFMGDRFVIRDVSQQHTLAGGVVCPPDCAENDVDLCIVSELSRCGALHVATLLRNSRFSAEEIGNGLDRLQREREIFLDHDIAVAADQWRDLRQRAVNAIEQEHRAHPEKSGMELHELRTSFSNEIVDVFDALVVDLCQDNFGRVGSTIGRRSHRPQLPENLQPVASAIRATLAQKPFDPPNLKQDESDVRAVVRHLVERGEILDIAPGLFVSATAFAQMKEKIVDLISARGAATVSDLRQELDTSRRVMVPLLELLDRQGVTRRAGDKRTLA